MINRDSTDLTVMLGNGDGTFQPATLIDVRAAPNTLALGDLNDDDVLDLVVATTAGPTIRFGNGDGSFGADLGLAHNFYASGVTLGDFDRDDFIDLLIGSHLLKGNGEGTFEFVSGHHVGGVAADFDQDGWIDLAGGRRIMFNLGSPGGLGFETDGDTMRWPGVVDADAYNVYRGHTSSLVDVDTDGLPDGDFGVCVSGSDPDPTDTLFTDSTVPTAGDGFFYIRSVVIGSGEDLGTTSGGLTRQPTAACP